jgi:hypothetical protein
LLGGYDDCCGFCIRVTDKKYFSARAKTFQLNNDNLILLSMIFYLIDNQLNKKYLQKNSDFIKYFKGLIVITSTSAQLEQKNVFNNFRFLGAEQKNDK